MIKQVRVAEHSQGACGSVETGAVMRWFAESEYGKCSIENPLWGVERGASDDRLDACAVAQQHSYGPCHPEISSQEGASADRLVDKQEFGEGAVKWRHFTARELGSDPAGQSSASTEATYNTLPSDGFVAIIIPFFSESRLPDEEGNTPGAVKDYREYAFNVSRGTAKPNFFCVRLSWNGVAVEQLCDPNDPDTGRTTGRILRRFALSHLICSTYLC